MSATPATADSSATPALPGCLDSQHPHPDRDSGYDVVISPTAIRIGPHNTCQARAGVGEGVGVQLYCWTFNESSDGIAWDYVRIEGTTTAGWIVSGFLGNGGSGFPCENP